MTRAVKHAVLILLAAGAVADEDAEREEPLVADELTDMEFLEYLGSWDESDADWIIFSVPEEDAPDAEHPPAREEDDASEI